VLPALIGCRRFDRPRIDQLYGELEIPSFDEQAEGDLERYRVFILPRNIFDNTAHFSVYGKSPINLQFLLIFEHDETINFHPFHVLEFP
jgi:hypothetical protein